MLWFQTENPDDRFYRALVRVFMNASDEVESKTQVFISHGWEVMQFAKPLETCKKYQTWVKLQPSTGKMVAEDAYLFSSQLLIPAPEATPRQKAQAQAPMMARKHVEARQQISVAVQEARLNGPSTARTNYGKVARHSEQQKKTEG